MGTASLHFHQPREYTVKGGVRMDVSRIVVSEIEHPVSHEIRVYGVLYEPGTGPLSRVLVMRLEEAVDLTDNLAETVRDLLTHREYEVT
jgi:hypothetical protein